MSSWVPLERLYDMSQNRPVAPYVAGAIAVILAYLALRIRSARKRARLPPGPKPLPLIGNLLDVPLTEEWLTWKSYVERYGDVVFLSALGSNFLLLGSHQAITDLIEKGVNFNSRPFSTMFIELMGFDWLLSVMPYGDRWRLGRKLLHTQAHAGVVVDYAPTQMHFARRFVRDLLASESSRPKDRLGDEAKAVLPQMVRMNFGITAVRMIYGIDVRDPVAEAKYVDVPERVLHAVSEAATPGRFIVDFIPWLKYVPSWFPGADFRRFADKTKILHRQMRDDSAAATKAQMAMGTAPVSFVARMLESAPEEEQLVKDIAGIVYLAGSDTTIAAVTSFFLASLIYPDVQKNAQAELDRVIGRHRLPEFADKDELPYLDAVMRECLRWLPVLPTSAPHATIEDDEYRGYFIPKDTIVLPFQWGLLQDPNVYPEPSTFSPERHLENISDGTWQLRMDVPDPRMYAFGFGRRVFPGMHIAEQSLFAILSTVLHTLDIFRAKDSEGKEVIPDVRVNSGLLSHTYPFPYELRMRADARELVDMCVAAAELEL